MAKDDVNSEMSNFSIQDTMNMGAGSTELLENLLAPETAAGKPEDLKPIIKEVIDPITKKVITTKDDTTVEDANKKPDTSIQDFLASTDETTTDETTTDETTQTVTDQTTTDETTTTSDETTQAPKGAEEGEGTGEDGEEGNVPFKALSKELTDLGIFSAQEDGEDPIETPEQFLAKFQSEKQNGAIEMVNNFIGQFGEEYQSAFDSIFVKGVDPKEYFNTFNKITDFTNLDLTKEDNQKLVLRQTLTDQGFEGEDINLEIEKINNYGDLEITAQRYHKVLVKKEAQNLKDMDAKASVDLQNKTAIKNEYITNVRTILQDKVKEKGFDGIPLNPKMANELHDFLLVDKYKTSSGETLTDFDRTILDLKKPENHATKVKVGLLLKMLEKDPTLSTIQKTGVTKKTNKLFSEVARQVSKPTVIKKVPTGPAPSWFVK